MQYVALTQKTAEWLLAKPELMQRLAVDLVADRFADLEAEDFAEGPMRASGSPDQVVMAIWNADFLGATGQETWGLIRLEKPFGLKGAGGKARDAFDRGVQIVAQRLAGLRIDGVLHNTRDPDDVQACKVRADDAADNLWLAFVEADVDGKNAVLVLGPSASHDFLVDDAHVMRHHLPALIGAANSLLNPTRSQPRRLMSSNVLVELRELLTPLESVEMPHFETMAELTDVIKHGGAHKTSSLTFADWLAPSSPLAPLQRNILARNVLSQHPLRIRGPAGSGKTLLMQLLAIKQLRSHHRARVLYITHNMAMAQTVKERFVALGAAAELEAQRLDVTTLAEYGRIQLGLTEGSIIDVDAEETKKFQLDEVKEALRRQLAQNALVFPNSSLIRQSAANDTMFNVFASFIVNEISTAIKGNDFQKDRRGYIQSERVLSRLHGVMNEDERSFVFDVFRDYYENMFVRNGILDSDDLAISLFHRLDSPLWELQRREQAYDYVFVDEAQLFNQNERRVFHLLTRGDKPHVPIAIGFDKAQDLVGQGLGSLGTFGFNAFDTTTQDLRSSHRCTRAIMRLALFVISKTTDLFSVDEYPDFTVDVDKLIANDHPLARRPQLINLSDTETASDIIARVNKIRSRDIRRIAIVILSNDYVQLAKAITDDVRAQRLGIRELWRRGEAANGDGQTIVVTRPDYVGGQEFDAVIAVGLEEGVVPPHVVGAETLAYALKQQAYREIYTTFSRARFQLYVAKRRNTDVNAVIGEALKLNYITVRDGLAG